MATNTTKTLSITGTPAHVSASPTAADKSFDFSFDSTMPRLRLSGDQIRHCAEALESFKAIRFDSPQTIHQEFQTLQANRMRASVMRNRCTVALDGTNYSKNRYTDVLPFDDNRVILKQFADYRSSSKGYINASFVMTVKCVDYFLAEDGPREFGNICIATKWIQTLDNSLILRCLEVKYKESEEPPLSVLHVQYPEWSDHGVPKDTIAVREIFKRIFNVPPSLGPIVFHCSAGIGRTGTYCLIHNTIERVLMGDMTVLDLVNTITIFRSQRIGMVETLEQHLFCYDEIIDQLENLISDGKTHSSL